MAECLLYDSNATSTSGRLGRSSRGTRSVGWVLSVRAHLSQNWFRSRTGRLANRSLQRERILAQSRRLRNADSRTALQTEHRYASQAKRAPRPSQKIEGHDRPSRAEKHPLVRGQYLRATRVTHCRPMDLEDSQGEDLVEAYLAP
jgi:hypothetical protein